ncbi:MAG: DUF2284 domain-containing protein [Syntrophomonas sp.]
MHPIIHKKKAFYHTSGSLVKVYPLEVNLFNLKADYLPYDYENTLKACQTGCNSYEHNGGCPPYSPDYRTLSAPYAYALILYYKLYIRDLPEKPTTGYEYMHWTFTESFMPRLLLNTLISLAKRLSGYILSSGHCIGCKKCNFQKAEKICLKPDKRSYSLEAVGVNIVELMEKYSDSPIIWLEQGKEKSIPDYQLRVGAILHNNRLTSGEQEALLDVIYRRNLGKGDPTQNNTSSKELMRYQNKSSV